MKDHVDCNHKKIAFENIEIFELGKKIMALSEKARDYAEHRINDLWGDSDKQT